MHEKVAKKIITKISCRRALGWKANDSQQQRQRQQQRQGLARKSRSQRNLPKKLWNEFEFEAERRKSETGPKKLFRARGRRLRAHNLPLLRSTDSGNSANRTTEIFWCPISSATESWSQNLEKNSKLSGLCKFKLTRQNFGATGNYLINTVPDFDICQYRRGSERLRRVELAENFTRM